MPGYNLLLRKGFSPSIALNLLTLPYNFQLAKLI